MIAEKIFRFYTLAVDLPYQFVQLFALIIHLVRQKDQFMNTAGQNIIASTDLPGTDAAHLRIHKHSRTKFRFSSRNGITSQIVANAANSSSSSNRLLFPDVKSVEIPSKPNSANKSCISLNATTAPQISWNG